MRILHSAAALFAATLLMAGAANAANMYMRIIDVPGESAEYGGAGEIEVLSWSWGASNEGTFAKPPNSGIVNVTLKRGFAGRQAVRRLYDDKREFPSLILTSQDRGKAVRYELQKVYIKSWSTSGDADDRPTEEVAFYYNKIAR